MFISIEGTSEGCGKSTQAKLLYEYLLSKGHKTLLTKEPGSPHLDICTDIRKILLDPKNNLCGNTELFLYAADRSEHIDKILRPHLSKGYIVITDRYIDSTIAIQGYGRELPKEKIKQTIQLATDGLKPDLTVLIDLQPEEGLRRAFKDLDEGIREHNESRFELEELAFHKRVYRGFMEAHWEDKDRFFVVDGRLSIEEIHKKIKNKLSEYL
jgi:dTMP kinase